MTKIEYNSDIEKDILEKEYNKNPNVFSFSTPFTANLTGFVGGSEITGTIKSFQVGAPRTMNGATIAGRIYAVFVNDDKAQFRVSLEKSQFLKFKKGDTITCKVHLINENDENSVKFLRVWDVEANDTAKVGNFDPNVATNP